MEPSTPASSSTDIAPPGEPAPPAPSTRDFTAALAGNPNVGKTTLFNALTGLRQKVANYPGVTVEKKTGRCSLSDREQCDIIDLPGTYSLASRSPDEHVARQVVLGQIAGTPRPDVIIVVADASNLERNLYLVTQVLELGRPVVVALSMVDVAKQQGKTIDVEKLSRHLRVPVIKVMAHKAKDNGIPELKAAILAAGRRVAVSGQPGASDIHALSLPLPQVMENHIERLKRILADEGLSNADQSYFDAHLMLSTGDEEADAGDLPDVRRQHPKVREELRAAMKDCLAADIDPIGAEVEAHYAFIGSIVADCQRQAPVSAQTTRTDRVDRIVTHRIWGMGIFIGLMGLMFWAIFWGAQPIMDFLSKVVIGQWISGIFAAMTDGPLKSLIVDGIIAGVGNVVVFLPQIALLFFFLAVLEDSGYMSRAAFLMDRLMSRVGLHGKSFIPLLSGFACAVPAIMGTRVIENRRDRLATILILPLMSCSARLPIYTLLISLFFGYSALVSAAVMLAMYLLGTFSAFGLAWIFKRTLLKGPAPAFILEMPPYRLPHWKVVLTTVGQRSWAFLKRAGTVIFAFSVVMWAATTYPKPTKFSRDYEGDQNALNVQIQSIEAQIQAAKSRVASNTGVGSEWEQKLNQMNDQSILVLQMQEENSKSQFDDLQNAKAQEILENSTAGRAGKFIAPLFKPLGFNWKISIGVTGAFFAREVIVSTMGICYSVGNTEDSTEALQKAMKDDQWPDSTPEHPHHVWTPLVAISLMVFVVFCMQCLSTLAIAKKETGHWGWPAFMFVYMTGLAWLAAFLVYQGGILLGLGGK